MGTHLCSDCNGLDTATIEKLQVKGAAYKHLTPVWSCSHCMLTSPVKYEERNIWVDQIDGLIKRPVWSIKAFLYGLDRDNSKRCLGCECEREMQAEIEQIVSEKLLLWQLEVMAAPVWVCPTCGYTSMILWKDRYIWAHKYGRWS